MPKITPLAAGVLIELDQSPDSFAGGQLVLADVPDGDGDYRPKPARGTIVACGSKVEDLAVGDFVWVDKYHGRVLGPLVVGDSFLTRLMLVDEAFVMLRREKCG